MHYLFGWIRFDMSLSLFRYDQSNIAFMIIGKLMLSCKWKRQVNV